MWFLLGGSWGFLKGSLKGSMGFLKGDLWGFRVSGLLEGS